MVAESELKSWVSGMLRSMPYQAWTYAGLGKKHPGEVVSLIRRSGRRLKIDLGQFRRAFVEVVNQEGVIAGRG